MQKTKKFKMLKIEKMLWVTIIVLALAIPISCVYTKAKLSESNIEVETMRRSIEKQEDINESLNMKISELASLDKIQEVANEIGLHYNNDNVKVVSNN